jgi:(p)ppGpp synthase/HD superfamily hydrolase
VVNPGPAHASAGADGGTLADLLRELQAARPDADVALVVKAYLSAESWHQGQLRKSGDPYITHPVAVARILVGLGADDLTLCAALLHDVLEDTACTEAELQTEFGSEIADLVHQASALNPTDDKHAAALTALAASLGGDKRVLFIKIADRLHNMRTIRYLPTAKQVDRSRQTLQVQVPIARALGADAIGGELADLASASLKRHIQNPPTATGRLLCASAVVLPAGPRARWREEWLAELALLPTRRARAVFATQIVRGIGRLAVTLRVSRWRTRR